MKASTQKWQEGIGVALTLLSDDADVARIGYAIGYESPSQFSREYRRLFGSPPGRDGQEIRRSLTPQVEG